MGAASSRGLAIKILNLSDAATHNGKLDLEVDEHLTQELLAFWKNIPQSMRDKITGKNKNKKTAGEPARGPISQQTQQVTPTHSNQAPTSSSAEEEATKYLRTDLCFDHWARVSGTCEDVMRARMSLTIRERFIKVAMGKLLDAYKKQKDGPKDVAGLFFPNMRQDAKDWANEGKKLESLCKGLYPRLRSQDSIEDQPIEHQHLGLLYFLPLNIPKEILRVLSLKDGENRTRCIESFKETFFARGIDEEQLKRYTATAVSLFSRYQAYVDPGAVKLSAQKHVFARVSLPPESHYETDYEQTNSHLHYNNRNQAIGSIAQVHDVSQQSRQSYTSMVNSVNARSSNGCGTLSPSAEIDSCGRTGLDLSAFPGSTSSQDTSDPARSIISDFPENRSQVSILDHGNTPTTNPNLADEASLEASSVSAEPLECSPVSEHEQTQQIEPVLGQSALATEPARINQRKRKRNQVEHELHGRQNDVRASQEATSFDIAHREQNNLSPNVAIQVEPTATDFHGVIGGPQVNTNGINSTYDLGGSQLNRTGWLQHPIIMNNSPFSDSAPRLSLSEPSISNQTNIPAGDFQHGLYTLFEHHCTSAAPPNPILWNLFPENEHSHSLCHDNPM